MVKIGIFKACSKFMNALKREVIRMEDTMTKEEREFLDDLRMEQQENM